MNQPVNTRFKSFSEFWPFYLGEHSVPQCRLQHFFGTTVALTLMVVWLINGGVAWLASAVIVGYGCAWWGHFAFEKNKPATFQYPLWSFIGDWKMFWMMLNGHLDDELKRFGIRPRR